MGKKEEENELGGKEGESGEGESHLAKIMA